MINEKSLEKAIRQGIPISAQMGFKVKELHPQQIMVTGGAEQNINVHQTAFAGSLYSICTLAAWGLVYSKLPAGACLVMEKASIEYLRPVKGEIIASAYLSTESAHSMLEELQRNQKARLKLSVSVDCNEKRAVDFHANLHISTG